MICPTERQVNSLYSMKIPFPQIKKKDVYASPHGYQSLSFSLALHSSYFDLSTLRRLLLLKKKKKKTKLGEGF